MTLQILPNYFKKIGIFLFIACGLPSAKKGYIEGYNAADGIPAPETFEAFIFFGMSITEPIYNMLAVVGIIGLLLYVLARDKKMDEFMAQIRLEAFQLTFFISAFFILLILLFNPDLSIDGKLLLELQVILFLIINKIKKWLLPMGGYDE